MLWRAERLGAPPSHVFGTMHSKNPKVTRLAAPVAAQFDSASSLFVEVVQTPRAAQVYRRAIEIPDGDLELLIGTERVKLVEEVGARYGMPERQVRTLKPWVLAVVFSVPPDEMRSGRPTLDEALVESAEQRGIPVHGLESMEEQIDVFDDLDLGRQIALLGPQARLFDAQHWDHLRSTTYQMIDDDDDLLWRALIGERNVRMVERMQDRLAEGNAFIAVGATHLPDEPGILSLLAEGGYRVALVSAEEALRPAAY